MELFPDRMHVRLRSRVRGTYLHADEDGVGVSLSPRRASMNTAWQVHRVQRDGITYVLLHGAAYGRYLALSDDPAPPGHRGSRAVQRSNDSPQLNAVMWRGFLAENDDNHVVLRHVHNRNLRANGRYRIWHTGVTVDDYYRPQSTMMHWVVEAIPPRPEPPELPPPSPEGGVEGPWWSLFWSRRTGAVVEEELQRMIRYVRAGAHGNFSQHGWATLLFDGRSVDRLRIQVLAELVRPPFALASKTLCVRAGRYGRLTPLVVDLPNSEEPMDIVVLDTGSPAAAELRYPDVDAP